MSFRINWDAIGITTSVACAIHCAVLPMMLSTLPIFGINIVDNIVFEYFMIFLALAIGGYSLYGMDIESIIIVLLPIDYFLLWNFFLFAKQLWHYYQFWFLPFAVILIVTAHLMNYRSCRVHNHAHQMIAIIKAFPNLTNGSWYSFLNL